MGLAVVWPKVAEKGKWMNWYAQPNILFILAFAHFPMFSGKMGFFCEGQRIE
jgi:hypothetical protein